jgi:phosphate transport system substrate-binding protein
MQDIKEAYEAINPHATIEIQESDSSAGMKSAIEETCDIGMASRALREAELEELTCIEIAIDAITVVVNTGNPTDNLTSKQVREIYVGDVTKWSET